MIGHLTGLVAIAAAGLTLSSIAAAGLRKDTRPLRAAAGTIKLMVWTVLLYAIGSPIAEFVIGLAGVGA